MARFPWRRVDTPQGCVDESCVCGWAASGREKTRSNKFGRGTRHPGLPAEHGWNEILRPAGRFRGRFSIKEWQQHG